MGLFDSDFTIGEYVKKRLPQLDNLENRELFRLIVENVITDLYKYTRNEFESLKNRVFDETPKALQMP